MKKRNMMMVLLIAITLVMVAINLRHLRPLATKWPAQNNIQNNSVGLDIQTGLVPGILIRIY